MVFSSLTFLFLFFPLVMGVYYLCPRALRNLWLLLTSLLFYAWGEPVYIRLMAASILFNYLCGLGVAALQKREKKRLAKGLLILCIAGNIGALGLFKYADLLIGTVNNIAGSKIALLELALPIGISFYTFQALSYVIDVYRGTVAAQKNPITFGTYIALFPQLIAGPIVQYKTVEEQLSHRRETTAQFAAGIGRFTIGLGKKVLIANQVGALWDTVAALPGTSLSAGTAWLGAIAFTFQIYFDFSGYSDMAIGMGRCMGFHFDENFNYPYVTRTITEFWRRWHISLGSFFRDYVYIPMGGNRRHQPLNILVVWFLTGLWHGASWNFVLWGLYFGAIIMLEKYTIVKIQDRIPGFILHIYSLFIIVFGWVIFYFTDISRMGGFIGILFGGGASGWNLVAQNELTGNLWLIIAGIVCCLPIGKGIRSIYEKAAYDGSAGAEVLLTGAKTLCAAALLVSCTLLLIGSTTNPFLYLRF